MREERGGEAIGEGGGEMGGGEPSLSLHPSPCPPSLLSPSPEMGGWEKDGEMGGGEKDSPRQWSHQGKTPR